MTRTTFLSLLLFLSTQLWAQNTLLPIQNQGKFGYIDCQGEIKFQPNFSSASYFEHFALATVSKNDTLGIVDTLGRLFWLPNYTEAKVLNDSTLAVKNPKERWHVANVDSTGLIESSKSTTSWDDVYAKTERHLLTINNGLKGLVEFDSKNQIIPCQYDSLRIEDSVVLAFKHTNVYFYLLNGTFMGHQPQANSYNLNWWPTVCLTNFNEGVRIVNLILKTTSPPFKEKIQRLSDSLFLIDGESNRIVYNSYNEVSFHIKKTWRIYAYGNYFLVEEKNKKGIINRSGKVIIEPIYNELRVSGQWFSVRNEKGWGLINQDGNILLDNRFDLIYSVNGTQLFHLVEKGKHGIAKNNGHIIIPTEFDAVQSLPTLIKSSRNDTTWFFELDAENNVAKQYRFNNVILAQTDQRKKETNLIQTRDSVSYGKWAKTPVLGKWGYVTQKGKVKVPFVMDEAFFVPKSNFVIATRYKPPSSTKLLLDDQYSINCKKGLYDALAKRYEKPKHWQIFPTELQNPKVSYVRILRQDGSFVINSNCGGVNKKTSYTFIDNNENEYARFNFGGSYYVTTNSQDPNIISNRYEFKRWIGELQADHFFPARYLQEYVAIKGGRWGYIDHCGIPTGNDFDYAGKEFNGIAIVRKGNLWGLHDPINYFTQSAAKYLSIQPEMMGKRMVYLVRSTEKSYGFINVDGYHPCDPILQSNIPFSEGRAAVQRDNYWYFVDSASNRLPGAFKKVKPFQNGLSVVKTNRHYYFIDLNGDTAIDDNYYAALSFSSPNVTWVKKSHKWSLIDRSGKLVTKQEFKRIKPFSEGRAITLNSRRKIRFVDESGQYINRKKYGSASDFKGGLAMVKTRKKYQLIGLDGKDKFNKRFDYIGGFSENLAFAKKREQWYLLNTSGIIVTLPYFIQRAEQFSEGLCAVKINGKWAYVNTEGSIHLEPQYLKAHQFKNGLAEVSFSNGEKGFIKQDGTLAFSFIGETKGDFHDGLVIIKNNDKVQFINKNGKPFISRKYDDAKPFENGYARVKIGTFWTVIDKNGNQKLPLIFHEIFDEHSGFYRFSIIGKMGLINLSSEILPTRYDDIEIMNSHVVKASIGNKINYYNTKTGWIWREEDGYTE